MITERARPFGIGIFVCARCTRRAVFQWFNRLNMADIHFFFGFFGSGTNFTTACYFDMLVLKSEIPTLINWNCNSDESEWYMNSSYKNLWMINIKKLSFSPLKPDFLACWFIFLKITRRTGYTVGMDVHKSEFWLMDKKTCLWDF